MKKRKKAYVLIHVRRPQQDLHILYNLTEKQLKNELYCGRWSHTHFPIQKPTGKCFCFRQSFKKKILKYAV